MDKVNLVPGFILKLWKMINDPQCDDLISWSDNGQSFIIMDPPKFSQELSKYFKHNNLSSFIRQLNMYGFRKVATIENSGLHPGTDDLHFYHSDFMRDHPERLEAIKRKLPQKLAESIDLRNVIKGISEIEDKQNDVTKTLSEIKRENEMLWSELHDLRQKHQQQQLYISRLMKLVFEAMEQNGIKTNMLQLKRDSPLMIEGIDADSDHHPVKKTRLSPEDEHTLTANTTTTTTTIPTIALPIYQELATDLTAVPSATTDSPVEHSVIEQPVIVAVDPTTSTITPTTLTTTTNNNSTQDSGHISPQSQQISPVTIDPMGGELVTPISSINHQPSSLLYETQNLVDVVDCNGDRIDSLVPSLMGEFSPDQYDLFNY